MKSNQHKLNRRDFAMTLAALAAFASTAEAQTGDVAGTPMSQSKLFRYDDLPVKKSANGGESRAVFHGTLATGEFVEVHETTLPAGQMPHPPHRHRHSEMLLIREGTLDFFNDGKPERAVPGDVIFNASMVLHGLKNVGTTPARYFVVAVGIQSAN